MNIHYRKEAKRKNAYRELFNTESGKEILSDLSKRYNILNTTFVAGDPCSSAFNEGARSVVMSLIKLSSITVEEINDQLKRMEKDGRRNE